MIKKLGQLLCILPNGDDELTIVRVSGKVEGGGRSRGALVISEAAKPNNHPAHTPSH
jgi:hypothetical protein